MLHLTEVGTKTPQIVWLCHLLNRKLEKVKSLYVKNALPLTAVGCKLLLDDELDADVVRARYHQRPAQLKHDSLRTIRAMKATIEPTKRRRVRRYCRGLQASILSAYLVLDNGTPARSWPPSQLVPEGVHFGPAQSVEIHGWAAAYLSDFEARFREFCETYQARQSVGTVFAENFVEDHGRRKKRRLAETQEEENSEKLLYAPTQLLSTPKKSRKKVVFSPSQRGLPLLTTPIKSQHEQAPEIFDGTSIKPSGARRVLLQALASCPTVWKGSNDHSQFLRRVSHLIAG
ncbi:hypothetical protein BC832DRAFT_536976 [Gaertneriomyces semiglobifer]|nr:hypothetical protein BC832DRAFT_536976 [Gaertneriomyces semiglobifer]